MLHDMVNLDHIQTDDFCWPCPPDESGPDFFFYELSWAGFCAGRVEPEAIASETSITVTTLDSLQHAMEAIFEKHAPCAIAVKAQHAYNRTLFWQERSRSDAERALQATLGPKNQIPESTRLFLGDWCWPR